jgi:hypothetical protein
MIPLRIGIDMDGTLADLSAAYAEIEDRLFGPELAEHERPAPELREAEQHVEEDASAAATIGDNRRVVERRSARGGTRHRDRVWRAIEGTPNFWMTLKPLEKGAIERLYQLTSEHNWEVFFITQRPATAGATVQWQTHKWLVDQGFTTRQVRGGDTARLPDRRHAEELRRCALGFVDARDSPRGRGRCACREQRAPARHRHRAQHA